MKKTNTRKKKKSDKKDLFHHITHITQHQTKGYWDSLNETEKKQWSNYMIHRFISMKMDYVEVANEFQRYKLKPKELYKLYINVLPKKKEWLRYIKGKKDMKQTEGTGKRGTVKERGERKDRWKQSSSPSSHAPILWCTQTKSRATRAGLLRLRAPLHPGSDVDVVGAEVGERMASLSEDGNCHNN